LDALGRHFVGLDHCMKATGATFAEAFTALSGKGGPIILIEEETGRLKGRHSRRMNRRTHVGRSEMSDTRIVARPTVRP
jgi:hypothetical protein